MFKEVNVNGRTINVEIKDVQKQVIVWKRIKNVINLK